MHACDMCLTVYNELLDGFCYLINYVAMALSFGCQAHEWQLAAAESFNYTTTADNAKAMLFVCHPWLKSLYGMSGWSGLLKY